MDRNEIDTDILNTPIVITDISASICTDCGWDVDVEMGNLAGELTLRVSDSAGRPSMWGDDSMWVSGDLLASVRRYGDLATEILDRIEGAASTAIQESDIEPSPEED